jgi:hypothetical protein
MDVRKLHKLVESVASQTLNPRFRRGGSYSHIDTWTDRDTEKDVQAVQIAGVYLYASPMKVKSIVGERRRPGWVIETSDADGEVFDLGNYENVFDAVAHLMSEVTLIVASNAVASEAMAMSIREDIAPRRRR